METRRPIPVSDASTIPASGVPALTLEIQHSFVHESMNSIKRIKQNGWMYSIAIVFNRLVPERLFRIRRFVVYRIAVGEGSNDQSADSTSDSSIAISRCATEADVAAVEQITYFQKSQASGNAIAFGAKLDDLMGAGMWAATECFDENALGVRICLNENQTWLFAALVPKPFRRRGLYSKLLSFTIADMAEHGYVNQFVAVNPDNVGSNRIHQRLSEETVGHVLAIRFLKTTCCWTSGKIVKDSTISWNSSSRPIGIQFESSPA